MLVVLNICPQFTSSVHQVSIDGHDDVTTRPLLLAIDDDRPIVTLNARLRGRSAAVQDEHALLIGKRRRAVVAYQGRSATRGWPDPVLLI
jgi:hypothetical protein